MLPLLLRTGALDSAIARPLAGEQCYVLPWLGPGNLTRDDGRMKTGDGHTDTGTEKMRVEGAVLMEGQ